MKRLLKIAAAGLAVTAALSVSAFAADFTHCADSLKELGLFQGTSAGYELDRVPTRAEAATMLVRLLGKEQEAKALAYDAPFTDLQGWEKPYVQYLYDNGLTTGATATTFEPEDTCTAQMYGTFVLRALDYSDQDGDFTYADAIAFAEKVGIYDAAIMNSDRFLRDHVVAASYSALALSPKDSEQTLLKKLTDEGAIEKEAAEPYRRLFSIYRDYRNATAGMDELTALEVSHELTAGVSSSWENREKDKLFDLKSMETSKLSLVGPALLTSRTVTLSAAGQQDKTFTSESYTADGFLYLTQNGRKARMAQTGAQMATLKQGYARVALALVENIETAPSGGYVIRYNNAGLNRLEQTLSVLTDAVGDIKDTKIYSILVKHNVSGGKITSQSTTMEFDGGDVAGTVQSTMKLVAVNDKVSLTPPANLEQYPLVR